ncbi:MAG: TAT-variant-translocated molybdopterin oxidoreductase [Bryobacteraceae bacterium]
MSSQPNLPNPEPLDLEAIRARLAGKQGPEFWRSLDQAAGSPAFQQYVDDEFTPGTSEWTDPVSRRRLLELLGATLGLAGLTSCTKQPPEMIVPYVNQPEDVIPGKSLFFATSIPLGGISEPVLAESHLGHPTKVEGNPEHPASMGATHVWTQAATLGLWDPDRSQAVLREGRSSTWLRFQESAKILREHLLATKGAGFRILTETVTSPTLLAWLRETLAAFPEAKWHQFEPVSRDSARAGAKMAFGEAVTSVYKIDQANVIVALDSDFLVSGPGAVRHARDFASRREPGNMNRLYAVEPTPSLTGASADHRLAVSSADVENFARALAAKLETGIASANSKVPAAWLDAVAADLKANAGSSLVIPGEHASPAVHAIAHAINAKLGNAGKTVIYIDSLDGAADHYASLRDLVADMGAGKVETLLIAGGNPVQDAPSDIKFGAAMAKVHTKIRLGEFEDETSEISTWHVPMAQALESWGDGRSYDGTVTLQQPLIAPLYEGKQLIEILAQLLDKSGRDVRDLVKEYWMAQLPKQENFNAFWQRSVHDGFMAGSTPAGKTAGLRKELAAELGSGKAPGSGAEILFRPCPNVYDGRFTNNAWMQELPRPLTKVTWENVVLISPAMATAKGISNGDVVNVSANGGKVAGPAWILPGQAENSVVVHLGYGRTRLGKIGNGVGFAVNPIRVSSSPWSSAGDLAKTGNSVTLSVTQEHGSMEGRNIVRSATLEEFKKTPDFAVEEEKGKHLFSLYPEVKYEGYSWGMAIDLNACTGCNACTIACQAENNISVVGKDQVNRGREMHWIRVDRYFEGKLDDPEIHHQPVTCMHCDNAPCEPVCPVAATTHSSEGLNQMTYNRCVGTRYCSNNCPYKVRRFNFFLYADWDTQSLKGARNPNVSVRSRGVMEKCTYCVQRINAARIEAEKEGRKIKDGEVVTACQQVCPSQAIHFGDLNDPGSRVAKIKKSERNYSLLTDLQTLPRTSYIAKLRNPNPAIHS